MIIVPILGATNAIAQNCNVDFPGTGTRNFSATCGGSSVANLTLGKNVNLANGDVFIFNAPAVINIFGNFEVEAEGSGKIIIPAGVTVNVYGNLKLDPKNSGCRSSNPCTFEIEVQGTLNLLDDLDNSLVNLIWSGNGAVNVVDNFKNSSNGCMSCAAGSCPDFDVDPSECDDDGVGCADSDFCATILNGCVNDNTNPVITACPGNQLVNLTGPGCSRAVSWPPPIANDNCTVATFDPDYPPGTVFPKGTTLVTYTATDGAGNTATCSFNVTVVDNTPPVLSVCPSNRTVNANSSCQAVEYWAPPTYSDNCGGVNLSSTRQPGSTFNKGTTVVTYTATDLSGNIATCSFNVTVVDNTAPMIAGCPSNITRVANSDCQAVVSWLAPTVSDNCGGATLAVDKPPGSVFELGTTKVTYTASSPSGEYTTCVFDVTVIDDSAPEVNTMPEVRAIIGPDCRANVDWSPPAVVDCNDFQLQSTHEPGGEFNLGPTNVTYTLTDALGNTSEHTFRVVVENQNPPMISNCPGDITIEADDHGSANVNWVEPSAEVACGGLSLASTHSRGQRFPVGTTQVVYTASDDAGSQSHCSFKVIVTPAKIVVEIAKVITPDDDGINDYLKIENIEKYKDNGIVIVDRWGSPIFKSNGYDNDKVAWRGTNMTGGSAPTGTYFFSMSIRYGSESLQQSGFIELIR